MTLAESLNIAFIVLVALSSVVVSLLVYYLCPISLKNVARVPFLARGVALLVIAAFYVARLAGAPTQEYGKYIFRPALVLAEVSYVAEMGVVLWYLLGVRYRWRRVLPFLRKDE